MYSESGILFFAMIISEVLVELIYQSVCFVVKYVNVAFKYVSASLDHKFMKRKYQGFGFSVPKNIHNVG